MLSNHEVYKIIAEMTCGSNETVRDAAKLTDQLSEELFVKKCLLPLGSTSQKEASSMIISGISSLSLLKQDNSLMSIYDILVLNKDMSKYFKVYPTNECVEDKTSEN